MNIKPFGDFIQIEPIKKSQILVSDNEALCDYGTVVAIGDNVKNIKVGNVIGYEEWGTKNIIIGEVKNYFISESSYFLVCTIEL